MRVTFLSLAIAVMTALLPSWAMAGDREIAQEIAQQLHAGGQLSNSTVMVKYTDGTAYLKGEVRSSAQLNAAIEMAKKNPNVTNVVNMIAVGGQPAGSSNVLRPEAPTARMAAAPRFQQVAYNQPSGGQPAAINPNHHLNAPMPPMPAGMAAPNLGYNIQQTSATESVPQRNAAMMQQQGIRAMPVGQPIGGQVAPAQYSQPGQFGAPVPAYMPNAGGGVAPVRYDQPHLPSHAWPSYAAYPNYAAVTYPKQYSASAWPYIGPFYPYPQVPLGWRKVTLEWDDGWWFLDFKQRRH